MQQKIELYLRNLYSLKPEPFSQPFDALFGRFLAAVECDNNSSKVGRDGGQVVSVLALYSDDPSLNPTEAYSFSVTCVFEKNKNKQKRGRGSSI